MIKAYKEYWKNMVNMNTSATRGQYWWPQLINYLILLIYALVTGTFNYVEVTPQNEVIVTTWSGVTIFFVILSALVWLANFTVRARRLHDMNLSNWWILLYLLPVVGNLVMLIILVMPGKEQTRWPINQSEA